MFLIVLLAKEATSQMFQLNFTSSYIVNYVLSYGFNQNGKYKVTMKTLHAPDSLIMLTRDSFLKESAHYYCTERQKLAKKYNMSMNSSNDTLSLDGIISEPGVYKMFIVTCSKKYNTFEINCSFSNPNSLLDNRNRYVVPMFKFMTILYCCVFGLWFAQSPMLQIFRYPLHTTFMFLPLIRALSLYVWYTKWGIMAKTESTPLWLDFTAHALDVVFFTTLFSSLLFLCEGCNIYRIKFGIREHVDIIFASLALIFGLKMIPIVGNETMIMFCFWLIVGGLVLYLSLGMTAIIKARRIMVLVSAKASLMEKIMRSKKIVSITYIISFVTMIAYIALYLASIPDFVSLCVLEVGCFACIFITLLFYTEVPTKVRPNLPAPVVYRSVVLKTPCNEELVFIRNI